MSFLKNGTVISSNPKDGIYIKCKEGILKVIEIQGENARRMTIQEYLRGNPIEEFEFIENNFRSYLKSTFKFNEKEYQSMFEKELNGAELYKGPYINATLPFKTGNTINELIEQGIASKEFRKLSDVKLDQKLYIHQLH